MQFPEYLMMDFYWIDGICFILGLCLGSFMNVCIHRIPLKESIIYPPSRCPVCGSGIPFWNNIPLISYIFLRGRCSTCRSRISLRYPVVELIGGLSAVSLLKIYGMTGEWVIYYLLTLALVVVSFIDIDHRIIPDQITLPGIILGFFASLILPRMAFIDSLIGAVLGGGILLGIGLIYYAVTQKEGMGGGDVKLLSMIGAFIGWKGVLFSLVIASFFGSAVGLLLMLKSRQGMKTAVPFGPFLATGGIAFIHLGHQLISWYFRLMI
jgi:leader peptidase (prepilin peptidase)/N-methyltransferase